MRPHIQPLNDLFSQIVYCAKSSDVSMVIIDGPLVSGIKWRTYKCFISISVKSFTKSCEPIVLIKKMGEYQT